METTSQGLLGILCAAIIGYFYWGTPSSPSIITEKLKDGYDYIVIGAGTAGCVLASRLSEDKDKTVLLEAGDHYDTNPLFMTPLYALGSVGSKYDWGYLTEPQEFSHRGAKENRGLLPGGKVLGGTNMMNTLLYARGSKHDFDEWASNGCTGWSYKDVLPYFLKSEDVQVDELKSSKYHHSGGPVAVSNGKITQLGELFFEAGKEAGYNIIDYNGAGVEGFSYVQLNTRNGVRSSSSIEFLIRAAKRENLHIAINSIATKIEIENRKATGVYVVRNFRKYFIKAKNEIILSAGAIASPQLLMLSGIGPKEHLEDMGIPLKEELSVGMNFQNHLLVPLFTNIILPYGITLDYAESLLSKMKYKLLGTGPLASTTIEGTGFFYTNEVERGLTYPGIQMTFCSSLPNSNALFKFKEYVAREVLAEGPNEHGFWTTITVTHPKSIGTIKLKSNDPFDPPLIDPQYFSKHEDVETTISGIRIWEKIMETPTMKRLGAKIEQSKVSFCSQHDFRTDAFWDCFARYITVHAYHVTGTCKMGAENNPTSVVDPNLRVKGIQGLRVVDGSVLPNVTTANTNAPIMMIAEKISDNIRGIDSVKDIRSRLGEI